MELMDVLFDSLLVYTFFNQIVEHFAKSLLKNLALVLRVDTFDGKCKSSDFSFIKAWKT